MRGKDEVAYIMKGFPRLSETFIANEIHLLETLGMRLRLYSVKRGDNDKVHGVVAKIQAPLVELPATTPLSGAKLIPWVRENLPRFAPSHRRLAMRRPWAYATTLALALGMAWKYRRGRELRKVFIKEFPQAGEIARQILEAGNVRHLHGHFCHGATTIAWFASRLTGLPFSFTAHAKDIYQTELNPGDLLERKLKAARFVATCTGANHAHLTRLYPHAPIVHTVYHGLDTDYFVPSPSPAKATVPLVLSVGRFVEKKGFHYLIDACARLKARGIAFQCLLVGEQDIESERIAAMVGELGLEQSVFVQNAVTQEELHGIYERASVFALPCQVMADGDRDGIPNVLVEAMAMALPVISTAISGIPELVADGVEGLLVPERDSAALARALEMLLTQPGLRRKLGEAARRKVCGAFDSRQTTLRLKALFVDAIDAQKAVA